MSRFIKRLGAVAVAAGLMAGTALAQDKPKELKIGIATSVRPRLRVSVCRRRLPAEMIAEDLNKKGGIGGVPVTPP